MPQGKGRGVAGVEWSDGLTLQLSADARQKRPLCNWQLSYQVQRQEFIVCQAKMK